MRQRYWSGLALGAWALGLLGCDSAPTQTVEPSEAGTLEVTITAPSGVKPQVQVQGPGGYFQSVVASQTFTGLSPGKYTVTAGQAEDSHPIVSEIYQPTVSGGINPLDSPYTTEFLVGKGQTMTATVTYAAQPGTGALWVTSGGGHIRAYSAAALERSGTPAPTVDLFPGSAVPAALAFDRTGNLLAAANGGGGSPWAIFEYPVDKLAPSANAEPLTAAGGAGALQGMAFDSFGDLWVTDKDASTIVEFGTAGGLAQVLTLTGTSGSLNGPAGIAFDANGNLWVANNSGNTVVEFGRDQLSGASPAPIVVLSAASGSLDGPFGLAFDRSGNLWVANRNGSSVIEFGASQLATSGSPAPVVTLTATAGSLAGPSGVAFDASGHLWVANEVGRSIVEFLTSQLKATGAPTPVATIGGLGASGPIALAFDLPTPPLYPFGYFPGWDY